MDRPKKILVVETDQVIVVLISHLLSRQSYVVHTSLDALEAEELLQREVYDAVLLEWRMPWGLTLLQKMASRNPALLRRVIAVTSPFQETPNLNDLPLHGVIRKPVEIASLLETVRACVHRDA